MNENRSTVLKKTILVDVVSAFFLALVFIFVALSQDMVKDAVLGAIVGVITGTLVSLAITAVESELKRQRENGLGSQAICNVIIGAFTGVIVVTTAVTLLILGLNITTFTAPSPVPWGVIVGALLGLPLGILVGGGVGAGWGRLPW